MTTRSPSLRITMKRLAMRLDRTLRRRLRLPATVYVGDRVSEYREYWRSAAEMLSAEFHPLSDILWEVRLGGRHTRIHNHLLQLNDAVTMEVSREKPYCYRLARGLGVPVPEHGIFSLAAVDEAKRMFGPGRLCVVKPAYGTGSGRGVTTHVATPAELENAMIIASLYSGECIVEEMIPGETYRLLYLDGVCLDAVRRRGVRVTGDGRSTIRELMARHGHRRIADDVTTLATLRAVGLTPESRIECGKELLVRFLRPEQESHVELRTRYDERVFSIISPEIIAEAGRVVGALECRIAGVDVITNDCTVSLASSGGALLEVNPDPGIHHHYITPEDRATHQVAQTILRRILQPA